MRLNDKVVQTVGLEAGQDDRIWFDDEITGFGLRVRRIKKWNGHYSNKAPARSWLFQYRIGGRTRRLVIGQAPAVRAGRARQIAAELHAKVKLGHDPALEKRIRIEKASHTLGALVEKYLTQQRSQLRPGSYRQIVRHLERLAAPLHALPLDAIDRQAIAARLNSIEQNSGAVTANRFRSTLSAMYVWGLREGLVLGLNPVINTNKREERPRERVLIDAELRSVWRALTDSQYSIVIRLLMLTGQRVSEVTGLRWSEIDFDRGVISLPGERTKNGRPHEVPISKTVRALLAAQARRASNGRELVFGEGAGPFSGLSRCKATLDQDIARLRGGKPLPAWVHHDLRRSFVSGAAALGVSLPVIEKIVNHVSGSFAGIVSVYQKHDFAGEKRAALELWDQHIAELVR
jgi:integrase